MLLAETDPRMRITLRDTIKYFTEDILATTDEVALVGLGLYIPRRERNLKFVGG